MRPPNPVRRSAIDTTTSTTTVGRFGLRRWFVGNSKEEDEGRVWRNGNPPQAAWGYVVTVLGLDG